MGRTATKSRSSSSSSKARPVARAIAKTSKSNKSGQLATLGQFKGVKGKSLFCSDREARALVARGISVAEAMTLCAIFQCTIAQLLTLYKRSKSMRKGLTAQARGWVKRGFRVGGPPRVACAPPPPPPPPPPPSSSGKKKAPHPVFIAPYLRSLASPCTDVREGDHVAIETDRTSKIHTYIAKISSIYESLEYLPAQVYKIPKGEKVRKTSVVATLQDSFSYGKNVKIAKGRRVRFYLENVVRRVFI